MKFFSAALAALAVGSAMAAPTIADNVLETVDNTVDSVTRRTTPAQDCQACPLPSPPSCPNGGCAGGVDVVDVNVDVHAHADVVVKINEATKIVLDAKALIKADIDLIAKLTAATVVKVDAQALLKAIVDLKLHVKILVDEVLPCLHGIVHDAHDLVAADLEVALKLIAEIQALLVDVEVCIKALVAAVKADVLLVIKAEVKLLLDLVLSICSPVVDFCLWIIARVSLSLDLGGLIAKITACINVINTCRTGVLALVKVVVGAAPLPQPN